MTVKVRPRMQGSETFVFGKIKGVTIFDKVRKTAI